MARDYLLSEDALYRMRVSPSGDLAVYASDESGTVEIYVRSFPDPGAGEGFPRRGRVPVLVPRWEHDQLLDRESTRLRHDPHACPSPEGTAVRSFGHGLDPPGLLRTVQLGPPPRRRSDRSDTASHVRVGPDGRYSEFRAIPGRRELVRGATPADGQLKPQIPWLRVFIEGVVIERVRSQR